LEIGMVDPSLIPYGLAVRQTLVFKPYCKHYASITRRQGGKAPSFMAGYGSLQPPVSNRKAPAVKAAAMWRGRRRHSDVADTSVLWILCKARHRGWLSHKCLYGGHHGNG
jgi:hypothetical protein